MAEGVKIAARNQKAFHEYFIDEKFEAGIELTLSKYKVLIHFESNPVRS